MLKNLKIFFKKSKDKKNGNFLKKVSISTLICFLINSISFVYPNQSLPSNLVFSSQYGKVIETFEGNSPEKIYLIKDLHCDPNI
ncbi:MAG: hypothetical protein LBF97_07255, partial [Elusimicrobiota bacterium]|nr:hypothetical protein [Elusimicrobiota bacterium]